MRAMDTAARDPRRKAFGMPLATAGVVGPIVFTALVIVQGLLQPDYSHLALPISALAAWPSGWAQNLNFALLGLLMIAFAIGLHLELPRGRGGPIGPGLLALGGVGLIVAASFPWSGTTGAFTIPAGHLAGAVLTFLGSGGGLIVLSRRLAEDPAWHTLARYALATGVAMVVLFCAQLAFARSPDAPLGAWGGLIQRVTVAVWFACTIVLAALVLRSRSTRAR
jgi:hypothetical membrane protein